MASCHKCGSSKITKRKSGERSCRHCGILPGPNRLLRCGRSKPVIADTSLSVPEYLAIILAVLLVTWLIASAK
jgi:hypothetical protein